MDYKALGKRIREERRKLNLTQAQLAEDIDISDTYLSTPLFDLSIGWGLLWIIC
jgi:transcriptional regulator with XRE-family HTH domain